MKNKWKEILTKPQRRNILSPTVSLSRAWLKAPLLLNVFRYINLISLVGKYFKFCFRSEKFDNFEAKK